MSSCCPICYRETVGNIAVPKQKLDKFFRLFLRYLGEELETRIESKNQHGGVGMVSCGRCLELMESFCELFHQLKTIELLMNWKVETLKNVMRCAVRVPSKMNNLQNFMATVEAPEKYPNLINSRRWLIKKCCQKLRSNLPTLSIEKWQSEEGAASTKLLQSEEGNSIGNTISDSPVFDKNQHELTSLQVSAHAHGHESPCEPKKVTVNKTSLPNSSDGANNFTDPGGTSFAVPHQIEPYRFDVDDPLSTHDDDQGWQGSRRGVGDDNSEVAFAPNPIQTLASDNLLKCRPLRIKIEPIDRSCTRRDVSQMKLENLPELVPNLASRDAYVISGERRTKQVSRLRSTHRYGTRFLTDEQLQLHIKQEHNNDQSDIQVVASGRDNDQMEDNNNCMDIDSSCFSYSSSSSDEQEDNLKSHNLHSKSVSGTNKKYSKNRRQPHRYFKPGAQLRLKCPDCSTLHAETKDLLLHRKTSKSCGHSYDPTSSVKVEVFTLPQEAAEAGTTPTDSEFVELIAVVDLPQEIHVCDSCELAVYSLQDMEVHRKLHGSFKCSVCKVTKSYAPDLALHERQAHPIPKNKMRAGVKQKHGYFNCVRCAFGSHFQNVYISHHLSDHLSLSFYKPECAICKTTSELMKNPNPEGSRNIRFQIGTHLKTHHDLRPLTNADDLKMCIVENCRAYFLTDEQLTEHQKLRHGPPRRFVKPSSSFYRTQHRMPVQPYYRLKCPDCDGLFHSAEEILTHRKTSDSCSGSYDPLKSVKVEVLVPSDSSNPNQIKDELAFPTVLAIIDLPQAIFLCDIDNCNAVQYSSEDLEAHRKLHGSFPCNFCKTNLPTAPKLAMHELKHFKLEKKEGSSKNAFTCPRCDFKCLKVTQYTRHHVTTHSSLTLNQPICPICKSHTWRLVTQVSEHATHFKNMHDLSSVTIPEDILHCTVPNCEAYFLATQQLQAHLWFRHNVGEYRQTRHVKRKDQSSVASAASNCVEIKGKRAKSFECRDCGKSYTLAKTLQAHRIKHHLDPEKAIPCSVPKCGKVFESKNQLRQHMGKASIYHKSLEAPEKEKVFVQCPQCNKSFSGKNHWFLASHMKIHSRSYFCEQCGKEFQNKGQLKVHLLSHSGPESWKFECSICGKKAMDKYRLVAHMRRHTNEKPYVCQICGLKYADRHNLRFHVNSKHGDVTEDKAKTYDKKNSTSKKGVKRKRTRNVEPEVDADQRDSDSDTN